MGDEIRICIRRNWYETFWLIWQGALNFIQFNRGSAYLVFDLFCFLVLVASIVVDSTRSEIVVPKCVSIGLDDPRPSGHTVSYTGKTVTVAVYDDPSFLNNIIVFFCYFFLFILVKWFLLYLVLELDNSILKIFENVIFKNLELSTRIRAYPISLISSMKDSVTLLSVNSPCRNLQG